MRLTSLLRLGALLLPFSTLAAVDEPAVTIEPTSKGFALRRDGAPYFIKGVGGSVQLEKLAQVGGNSIRTWSVGAETKRLLDQAHKAGLTVTLGLRLERAGGRFDYGDEASLERQLRAVERAVERHREHPALLLWGLGNEVEAGGDDPRVYEQLEALAKRVKELDPEHPTMAVIAELGEGGKKIADLNRLAPTIDIIGINSYGSIRSVARRYRSAGGQRPYIITEHGPQGHWEAERTPWGVPIELSSTEKARWYRDGYEAAVLDQPLCLGAYTFLWGDKQETTATWYGMLLDDGTLLGAVDAMSELWTDAQPKNRAPVIDSLEVDREIVAPGKTIKATLVASDPDRDELEVEWVLRKASTTIGAYGAPEERQEELPRAIASTKRRSARVRMPREPGPYRLFAYVRDGEGHGAVHNAPLLVER